MESFDKRPWIYVLNPKLKTSLKNYKVTWGWTHGLGSSHKPQKKKKKKNCWMWSHRKRSIQAPHHLVCPLTHLNTAFCIPEQARAAFQQFLPKPAGQACYPDTSNHLLSFTGANPGTWSHIKNSIFQPPLQLAKCGRVRKAWAMQRE